MFPFRLIPSIIRIHNNIAKQQIRYMMDVKKPVLYGDEASPPVRFALMTAYLLKVDLEFYKIDLFKGENKTDFFKKINPLQKVPVLSVNGKVICDSHAIALYLCRTRQNNGLYPKDPMLRSKIDELMFFNSGVLFPIDSAVFTDFFAGIRQQANEIHLNKWYCAMDYLEFILSKHRFLVGDKMYLCDLCCATTISSLEILIPFLERHGNVKNWIKKLNSNPCFKINSNGIERLKSFVQFCN